MKICSTVRLSTSTDQDPHSYIVTLNFMILENKNNQRLKSDSHFGKAPDGVKSLLDRVRIGPRSSVLAPGLATSTKCFR